MNSKGKNMKMYIDGRHGKSGGRYYIQAYGTHGKSGGRYYIQAYGT